MKLFTATRLSSALLVGFSIQGAFAAPAHLQRPSDVAGSSPKFSSDPNANKYCVWWIDSDGTWTCQAVRNAYGVEAEDFILWVRPISTDVMCGKDELTEASEPGIDKVRLCHWQQAARQRVILCVVHG